MPNELTVFNSSDFGEIRTIEEDGKLLFCGKDVAIALGYADPTNAMKQHCRGVVKRHLTDSLGREQETNFIPEGDVYRLIARSQLPTAEKFEKWIFDEVVPSVVKTGSYVARPMTTAQMFSMQAQINMEMEERLAAIESRAEQAEAKITQAVGVFALPALAKDGWQEKMNKAISAYVEENHLSHQKARGELYAELEETAGVDLAARQRNLKARMRKNGATSKEAQAVTKLHVIAQSQQLRPIFEGIVRKAQAQSWAS